MFEIRESHRYDDIISLSYPDEVKRSRSSTVDRAAQFSPFAALTGYEAAVAEAARLTEEKIELDESEMAALDEKLRRFQELQSAGMVSITYFQRDDKKSGGAYLTVSGFVKKFEYHPNSIVLQSGLRIPVEDLIAFEFETP